MKRPFFLTVVTLTLAGCATANNYLAQRSQTTEYYRVFDLKTTATRQSVAKAASEGLGRNVNEVQEAIPIPTFDEAPDKPGRIKIVNPFEGTAAAAMLGGGGSLGYRIATCDGATWTAKAERRIPDTSGLNLTACIFQYKDGYHLNLYAVFTKQQGGLMQISRDIVSGMSGTPEEWTEKTFLDIVRSIRTKTGAEVVLLEAQPEITGTPWLDSGDVARK